MTEAAQEADEDPQQAAYNPDTKEINWDCPCLGGMAHGPCGEQFKDAFSCFVFSEEEPRGIECVEKFSAMQNCFRQHPEHYKDEIQDFDDDEGAGGEGGKDAGADAGAEASQSSEGKSKGGKQEQESKSGQNDDDDDDEGFGEFKRELEKEK